MRQGNLLSGSEICVLNTHCATHVQNKIYNHHQIPAILRKFLFNKFIHNICDKIVQDTELCAYK